MNQVPHGAVRPATRDDVLRWRRGGCHNYVRSAIRDQLLPPAYRCACADCGAEAEVYDHRDYTRPLEVQAVCHRCNVVRGPAAVWHELSEPERAFLEGRMVPMAVARAWWRRGEMRRAVYDAAKAEIKARLSASCVEAS